MCMFCAAIPMSASVGIALAGKQNEKRREGTKDGRNAMPTRLPMNKATLVVTGGLLVCSVVYHVIIMPRTGIIM